MGPILGGICASIVYNLILKAEDKEAKPEGYDKAQTKEIAEWKKKNIIWFDFKCFVRLIINL